jgi:hypothetical protein
MYCLSLLSKEKKKKKKKKKTKKKKKKKKKKKPTPENKNLAEKKNRDELTFIFCIRQLISRHTFNFYFCEITPVCPATIFFN